MSNTPESFLPLSLSDGQLVAIMAAAGQLQQPDRALFLETVAAHLRGVPDEGLGDGSVHCVVRAVLGDFLRGRTALDGNAGPTGRDAQRARAEVRQGARVDHAARPAAMTTSPESIGRIWNSHVRHKALLDEIIRAINSLLSFERKMCMMRAQRHFQRSRR